MYSRHKLFDSKSLARVDLIGKASSIKPDYFEVHCHLGNSLTELGTLDEAISSYHKALVIKPDYAEALCNLGNVLQGALLEFCDLESDDACMEFHKSDRPVKAASSVQVRRPIYDSSVQSWKRYEEQLAPLLAVLNG